MRENLCYRTLQIQIIQIDADGRICIIYDGRICMISHYTYSSHTTHIALTLHIQLSHYTYSSHTTHIALTLHIQITQVDADGRICIVWYYKYDHRNTGEFVLSTTGEFVSSNTKLTAHTSRRRRENFGCLILQIWMFWLSDTTNMDVLVV